MTPVVRAVNRTKAWRERRRNSRLRAESGLTSLIEESRSILFLCYGNINRSALAERHLRELVSALVTVRSCGLYRLEHRPADPQMQRLAAEHGVSLQDWASRRVSAELVEDADLILGMEAWHLISLYREFPKARGRSYLLGATTQDLQVPLEIPDPYGRSVADYRASYEQVTRATSQIATLIASGQPPKDED